MRIIVVGCGKVGETIVKCLSSESHDIAVIDVDPGVVEDMSEQFDVLGVVGNGASYSVLREAGVEDADLLIAIFCAACLPERSATAIRLPVSGTRSTAKRSDTSRKSWGSR